YYIGSPALCERLGYHLPHQKRSEELQQEGNTVVCVSSRHETLGIIAISDRIRPNAREAVAELGAMGITTAMLTGDNEATARNIASRLEIEHVWAELTPEDKTDVVRRLNAEFGPTAVVGDGINDAPALAEASVGIAMGAAGTDAAIEAADTALMGDDLTKVPLAIRIGRRARRISNQNIVFSLLVLAVMIPAAVGGVISVATAVLVHEASELLAVANGLRVGTREGTP
ncbi:MAG: cation-translocating P-type ATPase, partial [Armatimonadetes bacterium]|nr:cation-translocating P-type ATPase [Armatimonadota bacterium]